MSEPLFNVAAFGVMGFVFCTLFAIDRERFWWAIIPGLTAISLLGARAADLYVGTDPTNDWASVLVLAVGAAAMAMLLPPDARRILTIVAGYSLVIGVLMMPIAVATKVAALAVLGVVAVAVGSARPRRSSPDDATAPRTPGIRQTPRHSR